MLGTDYPYTLGDWLGVEKILALNCPETERTASSKATPGVSSSSQHASDTLIWFGCTS